MIQLPINENTTRVIRHNSDEKLSSSFFRAKVLVATIDTDIKSSMRQLLGMYPVVTIWARAMEEVKSVIAQENVAACFCGFWLVDGTFRDVVRHLRRRPAEIPTIIMCPPDCPHEYRNYLAALNIRTFDFICHPYRKTDLERILQAAMTLTTDQACVNPFR